MNFLNCMIVQVILNDPFLGKRIEEGNFTIVPLRDEFLENARLFIFETYCRIHQRIDMGYVPEMIHDFLSSFICLFLLSFCASRQILVTPLSSVSFH